MFHKNLKAKNIGSGLVLIEDAFEISQEFLFDYISFLQEIEQGTFTYVIEDGKRYAINRTGFKFDPEEVSFAPERFIDLLCRMSDRKPTQEQVQLIKDLEDLVYRSLVEYCKIYPEAAVVSWWRTHGHIATYSNGQVIGPHADDQIGYEYGKPPKNEYPKHSNISINIYLNDGVDSKEELSGTNFTGGDILFKYANYKHKPKMGSIAIYPANYIGTHEVEPVTGGKRIAYLSAVLYGTPENMSPIPIDGDSRIWMPNLKKDAGLIS